MAARYAVYRSRREVKARKITSPYGETVITEQGPIHVAKGDYEVLEMSPDRSQLLAVRVMSGDDFEREYVRAGRSGKKATGRKTATSEETPPVVAGVKKGATTPDESDSAVARVKAATAAKKDGK